MDDMPEPDPVKRSHELEGLNPADLLRQGAAADTFPGKGEAFEPPSLAELEAIFPRFEFLSLIGKGGMGAVYQVRQRDLDRVVALKILPPSIGGSPDFVERFSREAKALAKLNHPGIVTIHESGRQDGLCYFLMEFVDGVNLRQLIENGRLSPREAMAIVPQICDALQFAHDQGIVHRDIKPENILLDRRGRVKVADFGIAKMVADTREDEERTGAVAVPGATLAGQQLGTPAYMAPEQIQHPTEVDHRADIYALGVVFYQMLTGELPGARVEGPSRKVQVDVRLDEVVLRALEKSPERRFQSADAVKTKVQDIASAPEAKEGLKVWAAAAIGQMALGMLWMILLARLLRGPAGLLLVFPLMVGIALGVYWFRNRADAGSKRRYLRISAWIALLAALPFAGFSLFFILALLSEGGGWHPGGGEALVVLLALLGTLVLPMSARLLFRASSIDPEKKKPSRVRVPVVAVLVVILIALALQFTKRIYGSRSQAELDRSQQQQTALAFAGELEQARAAYQRSKARNEEGIASILELEKAEDQVLMLEAEATGDPIKMAEAKLTSAERRYERVHQLHLAGQIPAGSLEAAKLAVEKARQRVLNLKLPGNAVLPTPVENF